jgi:gliding motility-associated-like protein
MIITKTLYSRSFFKVFITIFCVIQLNQAYSQCTNTCGTNLVYNGGFETFSATCGNNDIQLYYSQSPVLNWFGVQDNTPLAGSTPDYFSPCAGVTNSANNSCINGASRIGLFTKTSFSNGREYVQTQLSTPLDAGKEYCFSMNVKSRVGALGNQLSDCDGIGAWFHDQGFINITTMNGGQQFLGPGSIINASPQVENASGNMISSNCVTVSGSFCATGSEEFLMIGNFRDDANTIIVGPNPNNYMYIDDVSIFEICPLEIDLVADNDSLPCGGTTTLTVNSLNSGLNYEWIPSNLGFIGAGPHSISPATTSTISVIGSYVNSCGLIVSDTSTITIIVDPCIPTAVINDTVICEGNCVILEPDTLYGGSPPYSNFQWVDPSNNSITYGLQSPEYCPSNSSPYIFSFEDNTGFVTDDTIWILVNPFPNVNAGQDTSICSEDQIQLYGIFDIGNPEWLTFGPGYQFTVTPTNNEYYVFQSNYNGCISYDTLLVNLIPLPITNFSVENVSCFGISDASIQETIDDFYSYDWGLNIDSSYISNLPAGPYPVSISDTNGCLFVDTIIILQPDQLNLNYSGSSTFCSSDSVKVVVHVSGGTPPYLISFGNGQIDSLTFVAQNDTVVTVQVIDANNCFLSDSILFNIETRPEANFNVLDTICSGQNVTVENLSMNATAYQWYVNAGFEGATANLMLESLNEGCYDVTLFAYNNSGCVDSFTQQCAIYVIQSPESIVTTSFGNQIEIGNTGMLIDQSLFGTNCTWQLEDNTLSNYCQESISFTPNTTGEFQLTHIVWNDFGCRDTSYIYIAVVDPTTVYVPNTFTPDGNEFNNTFRPILGGQFDQYSYHLLIFNRWGQLIFESRDVNTGWDGTFNGVLAQDGVYVWQLSFKELMTDNKLEYIGHLNLIR